MKKTIGRFSSNILMLSAVCLSAPSFADSESVGDKATFECMNKKTFAIDETCMSKSIENNFAFQKAQNLLVQKAEETNDRVMATMTFDSRNMTIKIVAYKDATLAKADTQK